MFDIMLGMRIERNEEVEVKVSKDSGIVNIDTTLTQKRRSLSFTPQDASREKENLMYRELGKTGLSLGTIAAAGIYGLGQIVEGFSHTNLQEMGNGTIVVLLASLLLPLTKHFYNEAKTARKEKNAIKNK